MRRSAIVVVGGGEHARVVADAVAASGGRLAGWSDEAGPAGSAGIPGVPARGTDADLVAWLATLPADEAPALVLGFGTPVAARRAAVARFGPDAAWATVVHPAATVSSSATLEAGAVVLAGAVVNPGARVGAHAIVNSRAVVEHDVVVGAFAHLAPGATVGGGTRIGEGTFIGLGAAVRDHIVVGADATVGMGAVVVADVADGAVVVGTPARPWTAGS